MALAALEHGIGCCWVSRFKVKELARRLNLPSCIIPSEILVFGYPERELIPAQKKNLAEITFYNTYR